MTSEEETLLSSRQGYGTDNPSNIEQLSENTVNDERSAFVRDLQEAFEDHMEEALDGENFFLTMSLTRNMSLLPSKPELNQAVEEVEGDLRALQQNVAASLGRSSISTTYKKQLPTTSATDQDSSSPPLKAYLILISAVVALSSIGPCLAKQEGVDATLKIVWRYQGTVVMLAPFAIHSIMVDGIPKLSIAQWGTFVLAAASYSMLGVAFAMSIDYTTVSNATILTNSQSVLLVAAKFFGVGTAGQPIMFLETVGVAIAFLGGVLAAREAAKDEDAPAQGWLSVLGDFYGIVSSIGGIGYIVLGKSLRAYFPALLFMVLNMLTASFICILWMYAIGKDLSWDRHRDHGVFGWMNPELERFPLEVVTVVVCNVLGTLGYVRAFTYFSSVVIAVAALLEPVVAAFTATAIGVGSLPGVEGWIGNFLVLVGTLAVIYPTTEQYKAEQKKKLENEKSKTPRTPYPRMKTPRLQTIDVASSLQSRRDENNNGDENEKSDIKRQYSLA